MLDDRMAFIGLDEKCRSDLREVKATLMSDLPAALDAFYDQVRNCPQARSKFNSEPVIQHAKSMQIGHWELISDGRFDETYGKAVARIGQVHAKIGLEPRWYIGGYALVIEHLTSAILAARWPKRRLGGKFRGIEAASRGIGALIKAGMLDIDLAISEYLNAAETARVQAEQEAIKRERAMVAAAIGSAMAALSAGDLTYRIADDLPIEYDQLRADFNSAVDALRDAMTTVAQNTNAIRSGTTEISAASDDLSRRTEQQAASLEQTAAALDEITTTVKKTSEGSHHAREVVASAKSDAEMSGAVVGEAIAAMSAIEQSSQQVTQIIGVIDEIAFQTNLLALNAGVEAARAGEAGRGFAVVASEVRALAQRSAEAAKEIKALISTSSQQVSAGVGLVNRTGETLKRIVNQVGEIDIVVTEIATSTKEQATALQEVNTAINQMDQVTQQNAAMVEETTAASHALAQEVDGLALLIGRFEVAGRVADRRGTICDTAKPAFPKAAASTILKAVGRGGSVRKPNATAENESWQEF